MWNGKFDYKTVLDVWRNQLKTLDLNVITALISISVRIAISRETKQISFTQQIIKIITILQVFIYKKILMIKLILIELSKIFINLYKLFMFFIKILLNYNHLQY